MRDARASAITALSSPGMILLVRFFALIEIDMLLVPVALPPGKWFPAVHGLRHVRWITPAPTARPSRSTTKAQLC